MRHSRVVVTRFGGPEVLQVVEEEVPEPGAGEVRVRVLAAGVSLPDVMMREGIHPEHHQPPFTPGWDLVGVVDGLGAGVTGFAPGQVVAAVPIIGAYAEYVCLPQAELVDVPPGLDAAEAVSLGLNYVTAWQMLHRAARVQPGQRILVHGASGGVGSALLQLGRLAGATMYGTCSAHAAEVVRGEGATPIDYAQQDFVQEMRKLPGGGVDVVFDSVGGAHIWRSRRALRRGGKVVAFGLTGSLRGGRVAGGKPHRLRGLAMFGLSLAASRLLPGNRHVVPYSIQWMKRHHPDWFAADLRALFELLHEGRIRPIVAQRFAITEARQAQELLGRGRVVGKIVLVGRPAPSKTGDETQRT